MTTALKTVFVGILVGAVIAFPLGMNYGRGRPLLSNPLADANVTHNVKVGARNIVDETRAAIHDATKPNPQK